MYSSHIKTKQNIFILKRHKTATVVQISHKWLTHIMLLVDYWHLTLRQALASMFSLNVNTLYCIREKEKPTLRELSLLSQFLIMLAYNIGNNNEQKSLRVCNKGNLTPFEITQTTSIEVKYIPIIRSVWWYHKRYPWHISIIIDHSGPHRVRKDMANLFLLFVMTYWHCEFLYLLLYCFTICNYFQSSY